MPKQKHSRNYAKSESHSFRQQEPKKLLIRKDNNKGRKEESKPVQKQLPRKVDDRYAKCARGTGENTTVVSKSTDEPVFKQFVISYPRGNDKNGYETWELAYFPVLLKLYDYFSNAYEEVNDVKPDRTFDSEISVRMFRKFVQYVWNGSSGKIDEFHEMDQTTHDLYNKYKSVLNTY